MTHPSEGGAGVEAEGRHVLLCTQIARTLGRTLTAMMATSQTRRERRREGGGRGWGGGETRGTLWFHTPAKNRC